MSKPKVKRSRAVALSYNIEEDPAPLVIAAGYGDVAQRIIDVAEKQGIPVYRDDSAVSLLCMLDIGQSIPPELYEVVAAIYAQLLVTSQKIKTGEIDRNGRAVPGAVPREAAESSSFAGAQN